jgi:hypothetical protein
LFAIMLAEIEQLDTGELSSVANPSNASRDANWLGKAVQRDSETRDEIACKAAWRRDEKSIFTHVDKQTRFGIVFVERQEDRRFGDEPRVKAAFERGG